VRLGTIIAFKLSSEQEIAFPDSDFYKEIGETSGAPRK